MTEPTNETVVLDPARVREALHCIEGTLKALDLPGYRELLAIANDGRAAQSYLAITANMKEDRPEFERRVQVATAVLRRAALAGVTIENALSENHVFKDGAGAPVDPIVNAAVVAMLGAMGKVAPVEGEPNFGILLQEVRVLVDDLRTDHPKFLGESVRGVLIDAYADSAEDPEDEWRMAAQYGFNGLQYTSDQSLLTEVTDLTVEQLFEALDCPPEQAEHFKLELLLALSKPEAVEILLPKASGYWCPLATSLAKVLAERHMVNPLEAALADQDELSEAPRA